MKIWEISWSNPKDNMIFSSSNGLWSNHKKAFGSREKAEEFYKKLNEAASLLQLNVSVYINEVELET